MPTPSTSRPTEKKPEGNAGKYDRKKPEIKEETEEEVLREQSMTETEQRPYLDTEGGE